MSDIDTDQIRKLRAFISQEQLKSMFDRFFEPVASGKNALIDAIVNRDIETIGKQAHFIKGSSSFLGMKKIYEICNQISEILQSNTSPDLSEITIQFENAWTNSQQQVETFLKDS